MLLKFFIKAYFTCTSSSYVNFYIGQLRCFDLLYEAVKSRMHTYLCHAQTILFSYAMLILKATRPPNSYSA